MAGREIVVTDQGAIVFKEEVGSSGDNKVSLKAPTDITADYTLAFPPAKPASSGYMVNADVSGSDVTLSFVAHTEVGMSGRNVLAHSVAGDGSTDDTANVSAAINATEGGGLASQDQRLIFPAGIYALSNIGTGVFDADDDYWLEGAGIGATKIKQNASSTMLSAQAARTFVMRNMTLDGNANAAQVLSVTAPYILIENVEFTNGAKLLKITGAPKVVVVRNCRFADNTQGGVGPMIDMTGLTTTDGCDIVFSNNYVEGAEPASDGVGTTGLEVSTNASGKSARCFIRDNHFTELGKLAQGAVKVTFGHDSIVDGNTFTKIVSTPIEFNDSKRISITNNKISSESAEVEVSSSVRGIYVHTSSAAANDVAIKGNVIVGTANVDIGIQVIGKVAASYISGVDISDNVIEGCVASVVVDHVKESLRISDNSIRGSLAGNVGTYERCAVNIRNIAGDMQVEVSGNTFVGGATSGGAVHWDRDVASPTAGTVHASIKDNFVDSMGQDGDWDNQADRALIFIKGKSSSDTINTLHVSGNRYEFTDSNAGTYGMFVLNVTKAVTFDSIMEFGAQSGGDAIRNTMAINRAGAAAGVGGTVFVPTGTFEVSDYNLAVTASTSATESASNTCIIGMASGQLWHGQGTIHDGQTTSGDEVFTIHNDYTGVTVRGLRFTTLTGNTGIAIKAGTAENTTIDGCAIGTASGEGYDCGIDCSGDGSRIINCHIINSIGEAIKIASSGAGISCVDNRITSDAAAGVDVGILIEGDQCNVTGNTINFCGGDSIQVVSSADSCTIQNNNINMGALDANGHAISMAGVSNATVCGNTIKGSRAHGAARQDILLSDCKYGSFTGNVIESKQIKVAVVSPGGSSASSFLTISNNSLNSTLDPVDETFDAIELDPSAVVSSCTISNNVIFSADAHDSGNIGVNLGIGTNNVVQGNTISTYYTGVGVSAGAADNTVTNNNLVGTTVIVGDAGTNTLVSNNNENDLSFGIIGADILRIGSGTPASVPIASEVFPATTSFMNMHTAGAQELEVITIAGNNTIHSVDATQAAASAAYDGMILILNNTAADNISVNALNSSPGTSGANIKGSEGDPGDNVWLMSQIGDTITFRFEHPGGVGDSGYWRIIGHCAAT